MEPWVWGAQANLGPVPSAQPLPQPLKLPNDCNLSLGLGSSSLDHHAVTQEAASPVLSLPHRPRAGSQTAARPPLPGLPRACLCPRGLALCASDCTRPAGPCAHPRLVNAPRRGASLLCTAGPGDSEGWDAPRDAEPPCVKKEFSGNSLGGGPRGLLWDE